MVMQRLADWILAMLFIGVVPGYLRAIGGGVPVNAARGEIARVLHRVAQIASLRRSAMPAEADSISTRGTLWFYEARLAALLELPEIPITSFVAGADPGF
jgi:hypothetical protein